MRRNMNIALWIAVLQVFKHHLPFAFGLLAALGKVDGLSIFHAREYSSRHAAATVQDVVYVRRTDAQNGRYLPLRLALKTLAKLLQCRHFETSVKVCCGLFI